MTTKRSKRSVTEKKKIILDEDDELNDLSEEEEEKVDEDSDYEESKKKKSKKDNKKETKKETKKDSKKESKKESKKDTKKDSKKESSKKESKKKETREVKKKETKKETKSSSSSDQTATSTTKGLLPFKLKLGFTKGKRKRSFRQIVSKQDLASEDVDENELENQDNTNGNQQQNLTYSSIQVGSFSLYPKPKYCDITGLLCKYTNPHNKLQYHSSCIHPLISSLSEEKIQQYLSVRSLK